MIRVIKPEGFGNIQLEDAPIPEIDIVVKCWCGRNGH